MTNSEIKRKNDDAVWPMRVPGDFEIPQPPPTETRTATKETTMATIDAKTHEDFTDIIDSRRGECDECGCEGVHVDTDAGEIIEHGIASNADVSGETYLMVSSDSPGRLMCDDCE